jgi:hypothetical protein
MVFNYAPLRGARTFAYAAGVLRANAFAAAKGRGEERLPGSK